MGLGSGTAIFYTRSTNTMASNRISPYKAATGTKCARLFWPDLLSALSTDALSINYRGNLVNGKKFVLVELLFFLLLSKNLKTIRRNNSVVIQA